MTERKARILVVDDEKDTRDIIRRSLENFYEITTADSAQDAIKKLEHCTFQIVLTDLVMPGQSGIELLKIIKTTWPDTSVMVISGNATLSMAVEAMKQGAEEFIEKPIEDLDLLQIMIDKQLRIKWQSQEIQRLRSIISNDDFDRSKIAGNSNAIQLILEKVKKIAPLDTTVLISGETGVGKELFAELIYQNSKRKHKKFVTVNCGSLPETLLESMLFGHKKGAFTGAIKDKIGYFEEANGGTLFLDEVTETSLSFQVKLLRALEKGVIRKIGDESDIDIDVRILAASNKNILEEVKNSNFREDLYYRLNVIHIQIPSLRERKEDIILMANRFIREFAVKYNKDNLSLSDSVIRILNKAQWNGNIRELKNTIEHSVALATTQVITVDDLPPYLTDGAEIKDQIIKRLPELPYEEAKDVFEKDYLLTILQETNGDVTKASLFSGIKRQNLYEKFRRHQIDPNIFRNRF